MDRGEVIIVGKLFLTSNGFHTDEMKATFLKEVGGKISELRVSIITTASPIKEQNKYVQKAYNDFRDMGFNFINFLDLEYDDPKVLLNCDVIYINGGNPFHLLLHIKRSGSEEIFRHLSQQNIIFVGVSAGAIVLGPNIHIVQFFTPEMNNVNLEDLTGLNLVELMVFPHYDREDIFKDSTGKTIEERLCEFEVVNNCVIHRMKDDQFILLET